MIENLFVSASSGNVLKFPNGSGVQRKSSMFKKGIAIYRLTRLTSRHFRTIKASTCFVRILVITIAFPLRTRCTMKNDAVPITQHIPEIMATSGADIKFCSCWTIVAFCKVLVNEREYVEGLGGGNRPLACVTPGV